MAVINVVKRLVPEKFWKKNIAKESRTLVNNLNVKNGIIEIEIEEDIKSLFISFGRKNLKFLNFKQENKKIYLNVNDIINILDNCNGRYDLIVVNKLNRKYFLEFNNALKKHVSFRYFKLSEQAGYVFTIYASITGKIKVARLKSGAFLESIKMTDVIKAKFISSSLQKNNLIEIKIKLNNSKKHFLNINNILLHDDILTESKNVKFNLNKDIIKITISIDDLFNNGWFTLEIKDNDYKSLGLKIFNINSSDEICEFNNKYRVTRFIPTRSLRTKLSTKIDEFNMSLENNSWKYNFPSFHINQSTIMNNYPLISIVIPNWNNGPYLKRAIDSIIKQSIGKSNIEIIFIDDLSNDNSREIMDNYVKKYPNFKIVKLDENTGAAATPRNIGLTLMRGKYLALLDPDDWYSLNGLKTLVEKLEYSEDDMAIGAMIEKNGDNYRRVFAGTSFQDESNIDINELPVSFFSWMGPQSILIRSELVKKNNLHFPEMRTSDDQKFFMDVMLISKKISQTKTVINYLNHDEDNISLMTLAGKTTEIFDNAIRLWEYLIDLNFNSEAVLKFISRKLEIQFERYFYLSEMRNALNELEFEEIIKKFQWVKSQIGFDPSFYFEVNDHKIAWDLLIEQDRLNDALTFIDWAKKGRKEVPTFIEDNVIYRNPKEFGLQPIPYNCIIKADSVERLNNNIKLTFNIYSDNEINALVFRENKGEQVEHEFEIEQISNGKYVSIISNEFIEEFLNLEFYLYVRWNNAYYSMVNFADLVAYDYDDLRSVGFFKAGQRLGFRTKPILYPDSIKINENNIEVRIRIEGYYSKIKGLKIELMNNSKIEYISNVNKENKRYYLFNIEKKELNKLPIGNYIIRIIYDEEGSIPVNMYAISNESLKGTGLFENSNHNMAFRKR